MVHAWFFSIQGASLLQKESHPNIPWDSVKVYGGRNGDSWHIILLSRKYHPNEKIQPESWNVAPFQSYHSKSLKGKNRPPSTIELRGELCYTTRGCFLIKSALSPPIWQMSWVEISPPRMGKPWPPGLGGSNEKNLHLIRRHPGKVKNKKCLKPPPS